MVDRILALPEGTRLYLLAPVVRGRKGEYRKELAEFMKKGYQRVKIDGAFYEIADAPALDKKFTHDIDVVVDRIVVRPDIAARLADSLEQALKLADGLAVAEFADASSPSPLVGEGRGGGSGGEVNPSTPTRRLTTPTPSPSPQGGGEELSVGTLIALAYPERIAKSRGGANFDSKSCAFLLANGRGATIDAASPLAREPLLAVAELSGSAAAGRILSAAPIALAEIETRFAERIEARDEIAFDAASGNLRARKFRRLGAISLSDQQMRVEPNEATAKLLADNIARAGIAGLPWSKAQTQWRDRVMFLRASKGDAWPDLSDAALAGTTNEWLAPILLSKTGIDQITVDEFDTALRALLPWPLPRRLDAEAPTHFEAPTGSRVPIDYEAEGGPKISIRVQELFGLKSHPTIAGGKIPLVIELLSPAHRPVQTTRDLPGFWRGSYAAVRAEMRGRYPRHPWPDDPIAASATRRAKPRKS
ncbi:MAG: ATP-dependent helicase C-terminal domain-containing protein, partial [Xanthobacteraceae bacterium]